MAVTVEQRALRESRKALVGAISARHPSSTDLDAFFCQFHSDFDKQLGANNPAAAKRWRDDRVDVLTIARATGSLAQAIAIAANPGSKQSITLAQLNAAFQIVGKYCAARKGKYCTGLTRKR